MRPILKRFDFYVCSSNAESSPISVWEAMSMQKAIISTDVGDVPLYIKDGHNGFVVGVGESEKLCCKLEELIQNDSKKEQNNASLNQCSSEEFKEFKELNEEYKKKFGFPFIIAVKGKDRKEILKNFRERVKNNLDLEFLEAKEQVKKIATFRLDDIVK